MVNPFCVIIDKDYYFKLSSLIIVTIILNPETFLTDSYFQVFVLYWTVPLVPLTKTTTVLVVTANRKSLSNTYHNRSSYHLSNVL